MLEKHLIVKTSPKANEGNVVVWNDYRVSVLADRLFRLEKSENKKFRDEATQAVWFRNAEKQTFTVQTGETEAVIATEKCKLILKEDRKDCRVEVNGALLPIANDGNLKGTYRTLDVCNGNWQFRENKTVDELRDNGVCSKMGVAVLDDSESLTFTQNGEIVGEKADGSDEYVFVYGNDYRGAVKALYAITGNTPLVPRFALGNWWSRYRDYTQDEYIRLMNQFEEREVPLTVATVDMDWHWSDHVDEQKKITDSGRNSDFYGGADGWTGYSWNTELFPDYKKFLKDLKAKDLKITLNLHPAGGVRWWEDQYEEMANALGRDATTGEKIEFDVTDQKFVNNYFKILHKPYEADGVDFWWIDWQQGTKTKTEGLDPLWSLNHYHYYDNAANHFSPLILSRYGGIGSHRYPLGFSGDSEISWETLDYLPYFTANSTNVGYTWWSHDIGGHHCGKKEDELFVRHVQFGVLSPVNRLHCTNWVTMSKEPWLYGNGTGYIVEEWLKFRHKLIPYLYSASYRTHEKGEALIEPLYYQWDQPEAYAYKNEYLFGGQLLVIPVTQKSGADGYARVRAWIPEGEWTDIFTGDKYSVGKGGEEKTLLRKLDSVPVLAKKGGVLPLSRDKGNSVNNPEKLDVCVWTGNGGFELFEDGRTEENTKSCVTVFTTENFEKEGAGTQILKISVTGDRSVLPANRTLRVLFKDVAWNKAEIGVWKNGKRLALEKCLIDCAAAEFAFDPSAEYEVKAEFKTETKLERLKARALEVLLRGELANLVKLKLNQELSEAETVNEFISTVKACAALPDCEKERLLETL